MADLTVTAASVVAGSNATKTYGIAGETITAGQVVYLDASSTGKWLKADSDAASAAARGQGTIGIALNGGAINQPIAVQTAGLVTIGATVTAGVQYYLSNTPGGICPVADVGASEYVTLVGIATTTGILDLNFKYTGVAL